jgi:hypothetical protein
VYFETQTKQLAQAIFLFSACSLAAIVLFVAATTLHPAPVQYPVSSPIYTYQNPFSQPVSSAPVAISQAKAGGMLTGLISIKWIAGISGLGALWLGASFYLHNGRRTRKRNRHTLEHTRVNLTRMNPLAVIPPRPVMPVAEQDKVSFPVSTVNCRTKTRGSFAHRTATAPCQSRFRPTTLVSSQTRFGRLG